MTMLTHSHLVHVYHSIFSTINSVDIRRKMAETCCCGCCTLSSATTVAVAICILESIYGLFWNIQLMLLFYSESGVFVNFIDLAHFDNMDVVNGLVLASTGMHIFWMVFGMMVLRANVNLNRGLMTPWVLFTYLLTSFDIGSSIYLVVKFQGYFFAKPIFYSHGPTPALSYLILTLLFSRGLIMWFVNLYLAHIVDRRGKEIDQNNSLLALYILSHLSHPPESNLERGTIPTDPPPAYSHPNYFPKYVTAGTTSLDTSWSLNHEDASGVTAFSNPMFPRFAQSSITDLGRNPSVENSSVRRPAVYGSPSVEQSFQISEGVLPC